MLATFCLRVALTLSILGCMVMIGRVMHDIVVTTIASKIVSSASFLTDSDTGASVHANL